jgi:DNA-binding YbaB/EbfC family protein
MKGGLGNIMKQAQAMQENMKQAQDELAEIQVEGVSGGGLVSIAMSCRHDVRRVKIDPELAGEDIEVLEDLVAAAYNDALKKVESTTQEKMGGLTAGMNLPAGMKLPF